MKVFFIFLNLLSLNLWALDCPSEFKKVSAEFESRFSISQMMRTRENVIRHVTAAEKEEFLSLQKKFNSLPHDTPDNINSRFEMQKRARVLVRQAVNRAGYRLLNPAEPSPYDAHIHTKVSSDGYNEYLVELRSLLVANNPLPHITIWMQRNNPAHNPWQVVTVGITDQEKTDYVSYRDKNGNRIVASKMDFLKSLLPAACL